MYHTKCETTELYKEVKKTATQTGAGWYIAKLPLTYDINYIRKNADQAATAERQR